LKAKKTTLRQFKPKARSIPVGLRAMEIERLSNDGRGIARPNGKATFISGALPGERVKVRYTQCRKDFDQAELISIEKASLIRQNPACSYYDQCGGCHLQHIEYSAQLEHKSEQLRHLFDSLSQENSIDWFPAIHFKETAYRHRVRFAISAGKRGCSLGFRKGHSKQVVDVARCEIVLPGINQCLMLLRTALAELKNRSSMLECMIGEAERGDRISISLVSSHQLCQEDIERLAKLVCSHDWHLQLLLEGNLANPYWQNRSACMAYALPAENLLIRYSSLDFTQVNSAVNQQMVEQAVQWLGLSKHDSVADFFSGVGNFSLALAKYAASVTAFELIPEMLQKVLKNAEINGIGNIVAKQANLFSENLVLEDQFNKVLLDPPRAGALSLCEHLSPSITQNIVYISCNPHTLIRDLQQLLANGFRVERACLIDMFPQTHHSEAMVLLNSG